MADIVQLSPAQIEFIKRSFPSFDGLCAKGELAGRAASQRYFTRVRHNLGTCILVEWDSRDEDWERFLSIGRDRLTTSHLLPEIHADDPHHGLILEEDLGTVTLRRHCENAGSDRRLMLEAYHQTLDALVKWQAPGVARQPVIASRSMDVDTFMWETSYFGHYCVTDYCGCEAMLGSAWEAERMRLARECAALRTTAIHRDFQSENVLLYNGSVRFVDFQGARLGPPEYDVASLLFDPYIRQIDDEMRTGLYTYYCNRSAISECSLRSLYVCAAQRLMQALGAYGNLTLHKGKDWYQVYIPTALKRLSGVMDHLDDYQNIRAVVAKCMEMIIEMDVMSGRNKTDK